VVQVVLVVVLVAQAVPVVLVDLAVLPWFHLQFLLLL
jgi:hypothetical protein